MPRRPRPRVFQRNEDLANVAIIFIDDMGYGDIGPFGAERATPRLDRMAKDSNRHQADRACKPLKKFSVSIRNSGSLTIDALKVYEVKSVWEQ